MTILLLVGSNKVTPSTSEMLGRELLQRLGPAGATAQMITIDASLRKFPDGRAIIAAAEGAQLIILACPLFIDSLPAATTRALELLTAHFRANPPRADKRLLAILNSGFPEPEQNRVALEICRIFCRQSGLSWQGGLGIGGGEALEGKPLQQKKGIARRVMQALDLTAEALLVGRPVPEEARQLVARPLMPVWLYTSIGSWGWWVQGFRNRVGWRLRQRPWARNG